jgi:hypothetical protein
MSDPVAAMRTHLLTQSGVTNLVSSRIYYGNLPENATLPAVMIEQRDSQVQRRLAATTSLRRASLNVNAYATTHSALASLGDALVSAIEFKTGTWGTVSVRRAYVEGQFDVNEPPRDGSSAYRCIRSLLAVVWHT